MTKSFTSIAVGIAIADGLLSVEDRVLDVLPDHTPTGASGQAQRITVHHLLTMTAGHSEDGLTTAWELEPNDLTKGFLRVPFDWPEGTHHAYDNATTYVLARMIERVTGIGLPEFLDQRLFEPMGIHHAEWDRLASGAAFGFHGLHLTTEAIAAFGELLLHGGLWGEARLVPSEWIMQATSKQIETLTSGVDRPADSLCGYGYQFWMSRDGYRGDGAFGQLCMVYPEHDLVVAVTAGDGPDGATPNAIREYLLPGVNAPDDDSDDNALAERLKRLSFPLVLGSSNPGRATVAVLDGSAPDSPLPDQTTVTVRPVSYGWLVEIGPDIRVEVGYDAWHECSPLGPVRSFPPGPGREPGSWQGCL